MNNPKRFERKTFDSTTEIEGKIAPIKILRNQKGIIHIYLWRATCIQKVEKVFASANVLKIQIHKRPMPKL